jgi:hypothetical protein
MSVALRHVRRTDVGLWTVADDDSGLYESACWFYRVCRYTDMLVKKTSVRSSERSLLCRECGFGGTRLYGQVLRCPVS